MSKNKRIVTRARIFAHHIQKHHVGASQIACMAEQKRLKNLLHVFSGKRQNTYLNVY